MIVNINKPYRRIRITYPNALSETVWYAINVFRKEHSDFEYMSYDGGLVGEKDTFDDIFVTEQYANALVDKLLTIL